MARMLLLILIRVHSGSCALWVSQPPEICTQEGTPAFLPVPSTPARGDWPLALSHGTGTNWPQGRRVVVLDQGVRTGNGTPLVVERGPAQLATPTIFLLRAGFYAFGFLSVAIGSTIYYQGKCEVEPRQGLRRWKGL
uniref:Natural cytotoxicity triggering receptor 3 n=1 Tax=Sus scrofa TaxID=9823 RepID=A0A4X1VFS4_PIG